MQRIIDSQAKNSHLSILPSCTKQFGCRLSFHRCRRRSDTRYVFTIWSRCDEFFHRSAINYDPLLSESERKNWRCALEFIEVFFSFCIVIVSIKACERPNEQRKEIIWAINANANRRLESQAFVYRNHRLQQLINFVPIKIWFRNSRLNITWKFSPEQFRSTFNVTWRELAITDESIRHFMTTFFHWKNFLFCFHWKTLNDSFIYRIVKTVVEFWFPLTEVCSSAEDIFEFLRRNAIYFKQGKEQEPTRNVKSI